MISIENLIYGESKGLVKRTTPIEVEGFKFIPWKITDDSKYESKTHAEWLLDNVPRSLVTIHGLDGNFIRAIYGLKKFGSVDETHMGSNIRISELIDSGSIKISVHQKHNGEAATITGFVTPDSSFYYVIMSKSVPAVVKSREELDKLDSLRFKTCKEIGTQLFDLIDKLDETNKSNFQSILQNWIFPIEKIDRTFKHIACEEPGLYILGLRNVQTLKLDYGNTFITNQMQSFGFKLAKAYSDEEIDLKVTQVFASLDLLPNTPDKPTVSMFENYLEVKNFLKVWSYVSLVYEQIACQDISALDILAIGSGSKEKFSLIEGTIISVYDMASQELYMIKDKDLLYYLLRSVRTIIEHRKNITELTSRSMKHWIQYLTPKWASAWDEFTQIIMAYTQTYDFIKAVESNQNSGIDAPDFFAGVLSWYKLNPEITKSPHNPIVIITTELEVGLVTHLITNPAFVFESKMPKQLPNGCVGVIHGTKIASLSSTLYPNITFVRFTEFDELICLDLGGKKLASFWKDLVNEKSTLDFCPSLEDLDLVISRLKSVPGTNLVKQTNSNQNLNLNPVTVYKVDYFDSEYLVPIQDINYWIGVLELALSINLGGKFDSTPTREQKAVSKIKCAHPIPRNTNGINQIVENVATKYQSIESNPVKLAVFMTGIPGLGKDYCAEQVAIQLEQKFPELEKKIFIINQDMYQCDANKYLDGLKSCTKKASIIFITRNGPGSNRSVEICKENGFLIHLITPKDSQMLLLGSCICSALERKDGDNKKSHVLSELPDDKIVSIVSNFFGALSSANASIVGLNTNGNKYLGLGFPDSPNHLTIQYGLVTREDLIGTNVIIRLEKNVIVQAPGYKLEFNMVQIDNQEICELIDSRCPHITLSKSGSAKPVHSGWWGWVVKNFFSETVEQVLFGPWTITIKLLDETLTGTIKMFG